jgi:midasin
VLLDEINLASGETLQRLCSLLDDSKGSLTITERGDSDPIKRHPDFRLIAAMNPATDTGKKDLPESIRSRFTEIYVDELTDRLQLNTVAAGYLRGVIHVNEVEQSESVMSSVDVYLRCRALSEETLVDSGGQRPRYSMRTFCRALLATYNLTTEQRIPLNRAILEGFQLTFEGSLDGGSILLLKNTLYDVLGKKIDTKALDVPGRRPGGKNGCEDFVLIKPFWLKVGPLKRHDWAIEDDVTGKCRFVLTPSARSNLRRLSRAIAAGPWPVLLEGPTSTGKTTLVEYVAALCGHRCIRINNHEHTDVQEYTGTYSTNPEGQLSFQEGLLVQALRHGHWVILDELNLAPSQVLEALNRLLDDNRELYIPELNELIKPHENFRLFATQNPTGVYGGRKALSKAFRNRFTELYVDEMPEGELVTILDKRCGCPPSHGKLLVEVMTSLRKKRSKSGVFNGKDGLITPRVLIRWAERRSSSKANLATEGYMLLAERLRDDDEKRAVQSVIESVMKVDLNIEELYWGPQSDARRLLEVMYTDNENEDIIRDLHPLSIAPTKSLLRLITLVDRCVQQKEPVLLVGGK